MTSSRGIHISRHYVVSINAMPLVYICTLNSKRLKGRTESCSTLFSKLNDHQTRCFNFVLRRIHPNGCKFELNFKKIISKTKSSKN